MSGYRPDRTPDEVDREMGGTWFTSYLYQLIHKADEFNRERLRVAFPQEVREWENWLNRGREFREPHVVLPGVTVISAEGSGHGDLMSDDSIRMVKEDETEESDRRPCGCYIEYHTADCPMFAPSYSEDDHLEAEYEDRFHFDEEPHEDDPSLEDTMFDHAAEENR